MTNMLYLGNGFVSEFIKVIINGNECEITSTGFNTIVCITPAQSTAGVHVVQVIFGQGTTYKVLYPIMEFEYMSDLTPSVTALSPNKGKSLNFSYKDQDLHKHKDLFINKLKIQLLLRVCMFSGTWVTSAEAEESVTNIAAT